MENDTTYGQTDSNRPPNQVSVWQAGRGSRPTRRYPHEETAFVECMPKLYSFCCSRHRSRSTQQSHSITVSHYRQRSERTTSPTGVTMRNVRYQLLSPSVRPSVRLSHDRTRLKIVNRCAAPVQPMTRPSPWCCIYVGLYRSIVWYFTLSSLVSQTSSRVNVSDADRDRFLLVIVDFFSAKFIVIYVYFVSMHTFGILFIWTNL